LFSTVVDLMSLVVCGIRPSVQVLISFSRGNWRFSDFRYNKINGIEPNISAELLETASLMEATIRHLKANLPDWLPGYRVKILDGNAIAATEHRLGTASISTAGAQVARFSTRP